MLAPEKIIDSVIPTRKQQAVIEMKRITTQYDLEKTLMTDCNVKRTWISDCFEQESYMMTCATTAFTSEKISLSD